MSVIAVVEGDTDIPVVHALARSVGLELAGAPLDMGGKGKLDKGLDGFNLAAKGSPWFVLRDLDHDAACAPAFVKAKGFAPSTWMVFTLAVREVEAWLLADATGIAAFLRVPLNRIPKDPDTERDPTVTLVNLARRSGRAAIKKGMVPKPNAAAQVGPLYEALIIEFASTTWSLDRACLRSPSLARTREALRRLADSWAQQLLGNPPGGP